MTGAGSWARQGRAAFVALHLFAVTAMALPSAGAGMNRSAWADPTVQGEFAGWAERLRGLGLDIGASELGERAWRFASAYESGREKVLAPFMPYYRLCGTWQSWRMFVAPHRYPGRLEIHVDRGQGWEPLYVARSAEHGWHRRWLDHDRFRASIFRYSWKHYVAGRRDFTDWVARTVAREEPDAVSVRVSWMRYRTRSPEEVREGVPPREKRELSNSRNLSAFRTAR